MDRYVAAIDQGTSSTRCIIFDHAGNMRATSQREHRQIFPNAGWVEHDPGEIWAATQAVVADVLASAGIGAQNIVALGITNQRETTIAWDKRTGEPVYNAIVWQDTRTDEICERLAKDGGRDRFRPKTGLPLATYFSAPKLRWMLDSVPEAGKLAARGDLLVGTVDSWLVWKLTGRHVTDVTNASRTQLMNLVTLDWDGEILQTLAMPREILPRIVPSAGTVGEVTDAGSPLRGVPIAGILGDQQAALFGQTCFAPGEAKNTYGTGCFLLLNTGNQPVSSTAGLLTTLGYKIGDQSPVYALEGSVAITGALVQWLRDNLGLIPASAEVEQLAASVSDNGGVYFVPAFSGLFAPYWRTDARGAILGLTRHSNKGHIARAALEATAFQTRELLDAMQQDSGVQLGALKVDGGMVANQLLMQFQADLLGVPVVRSQVAETTALGAAYAAGLAVGFWKDTDQLRSNWQEAGRWKPGGDPEMIALSYSKWKKAVSRTFNWMDPSVSG